MLFLLRFCFMIYETPKYLLGRGRDAEAVAVIQNIAARNKTTTWLTVSHLQAVDTRPTDGRTNDTSTTEPKSAVQVVKSNLRKFSKDKVKALFSTPRLALFLLLLIFLWCSIGIVYLLYNSFIPIYL